MTHPETNVETFRWGDGKLEMIDQRLLPADFCYVACTSAAETAEAIRKMVVRGAPAIGVAAAFGVALEALRCKSQSQEEFSSSLHSGIALLAASRPTAVNLFWALERMQQLWHEQRGQANAIIAERLQEEALAIYREDIRINREIGRLGAELLPQNGRILTHCNAGALATAGYGTALGVIRAAVNSGKNISVIAGETRPFLQGARLTAWELQRDNIPITLITDNMAGFLMKRGEIDGVIVGADRVTANGDVVNKIGTYILAVLAKQHGLPFYVACPISTLDPATATGNEVQIEERSPAEVTGFGNSQWAPAGIKVRNPAFDITPAGLVSALITEKGIVEKPDREKIAALLCA